VFYGDQNQFMDNLPNNQRGEIKSYRNIIIVAILGVAVGFGVLFNTLFVGQSFEYSSNQEVVLPAKTSTNSNFSKAIFLNSTQSAGSNIVANEFEYIISEPLSVSSTNDLYQKNSNFSNQSNRYSSSKLLKNLSLEKAFFETTDLVSIQKVAVELVESNILENSAGLNISVSEIEIWQQRLLIQFLTNLKPLLESNNLKLTISADSWIVNSPYFNLYSSIVDLKFVRVNQNNQSQIRTNLEDIFETTEIAKKNLVLVLMATTKESYSESIKSMTQEKWYNSQDFGLYFN
jgi:hypothetical protein